MMYCLQYNTPKIHKIYIYRKTGYFGNGHGVNNIGLNQIWEDLKQGMDQV